MFIISIMRVSILEPSQLVTQHEWQQVKNMLWKRWLDEMSFVSGVCAQLLHTYFSVHVQRTSCTIKTHMLIDLYSLLLLTVKDQHGPTHAGSKCVAAGLPVLSYSIYCCILPQFPLVLCVLP